MKRQSLPTSQQEQYIMLLFKQGKTLSYIKSATNSAWDDSVYDALRKASLS